MRILVSNKGCSMWCKEFNRMQQLWFLKAAADDITIGLFYSISSFHTDCCFPTHGTVLALVAAARACSYVRLHTEARPSHIRGWSVKVSTALVLVLVPAIINSNDVATEIIRRWQKDSNFIYTEEYSVPFINYFVWNFFIRTSTHLWITDIEHLHSCSHSLSLSAILNGKGKFEHTSYFYVQRNNREIALFG